MKKFLLFVCLFLIGCSSTKEQDLVENLPVNFKNLKNMGNDWWLFDLEVNGRIRTFLYRRKVSGVRTMAEAVTEVRGME